MQGRQGIAEEVALRERRPGSDPEEPAPQVLPHRLIALQRTAGNQAVRQMISRFPETAVRERAAHVGDWVEAKIQVRAHEIHTETKRDDEKANYFQAQQEVDQAWRHLTNLEAGTIITVDEWVVMKRGLSTEEYFRALKAFNEWKGAPDVKEKFLEDLPQDKLYLFSDALARRELGPGETIKGQVAASANPERAKQAQQELSPIKLKDKLSQARITDKLFALLVWGVAYPRSGDPEGNEGIIGIHHAVEAAHALVEMPQAAYLETILQLDLTGGAGQEFDWNQRRVESVLILKAVAARRAEYAAAPGTARQTVTDFAGDIRGQDPADLAEWTSTRDIGQGGLQQRFTMTCSPTTIQILTGEGDPVFALEVAAIGKHGLDWENDVGDEQETKLGKAVAPRLLKDRWDAFLVDINGLSLAPAELSEWQALLDWMAGSAVDAAALGKGRGHAKALGYTDKELDDFKKYQVGLTTEPGLSYAEVDALVSGMPDISVAGATRRDFTAAAPVDDPALDEVWKRLFRGIDVAIVVVWTTGGGHAMSLTDAKGTPPTGGNAREFLLSDPWHGTSEWLTAAQLKAGDFGGSGNGRITMMHY